MPRGVKTDPEAPITIDGELLLPVPWSELEYFVEPDEVVGAPAPSMAPTVRIAGPTTGVYCLRGAGLIKIGLASCVLQRFRTIATFSPVRLEPVGFIPTPTQFRDAIVLERELHARFAADRQHGEWFTETPALTAFMETHLAAWPVSQSR